MHTPRSVGPEGAVAAVLDVLDLTRTGDTTFTGVSLDKFNQRVYGGQVLAQAALAAGHTLPEAQDEAQVRKIHSSHAYFLRPGRLDVPIDFEVERLHDGRSFSTRRTHALQEGVPILAMTASFQLSQPGVEAPRVPHEVPRPEELPSALNKLESLDHPAAVFMAESMPMDLRYVEGDVFLSPDPERGRAHHTWLRFRSPLPEDLDQLTRRALLVYACDQLTLEPVLRATGLHWMHPGLSAASLDHSMHWHRDIEDVNGWFLFQQRCVDAHGGRGKGAGDIFDSRGRMVASYTQEGMIRVPEASEHQRR